MTRTTRWTPAEHDILTRMWLDGKSASMIARELPGRTRNAIIGRLSRRGLLRTNSRPTTRLPYPRGPRQRPSAPTTPRQATVHVLPPRDLPDIAPPPEIAPTARADGLAGILDLTGQTCRWPIGDPREPGFGFCGQLPMAGKPYCCKHMAVAYQRRPAVEDAA